MTAPAKHEIRRVQFDVSSEAGMSSFLATVSNARLSGKRVVVEIVEASRSPQQNNALHLWLEMVAHTLNAAGLDMRRAIRKEVDIPWTKESVKRYLWKPLQEVMTGHESSTRPSKTQYPDISETLTRHFAEKFGVQLPAWPVREAL